MNLISKALLIYQTKKIDVLIELFDNLKRKVNSSQANITDDELLEQTIIELSTHDSKERLISYK